MSFACIQDSEYSILSVFFRTIKLLFHTEFQYHPGFCHFHRAPLPGGPDEKHDPEKLISGSPAVSFLDYD